MDTIKTGALIAQARKDKGLTQRELAEKVYVSVQAVSKWELGKNFPDLSLMEPLAEALDLTVTELLAGERGEEPGEEAVRDSLRFGLEQLGPKIRKWRWLFVLAAAALAALLSWTAYAWVRENTELLPQKETTIQYLTPSDQDRQIANAFGSSRSGLYLYEVTLADSMKECIVQAELWTHDGMERSWPFLEISAEDRTRFGPRRQLLVLSVEPHSKGWSKEEQRYTQMWFECGLNFAGCSSRRATDIISSPYISGGVSTATPMGPTVYRHRARQLPAVMDPEDGLVLMTASIGGPDGGTYAPSEILQEETVQLVIRMYCK